VVDWSAVAISVAVSVPAFAIAILTWIESRKQSQLLKTMVETLPLLTPKPKRRSPRKRPAAPPGTTGLVSVPSPPQISRTQRLKEEAAERARLRRKLQQEREQWRRQKDVAKAIGWFIDRLDAREYDDEDDE
jgi:hypothetical protein